MKTWFTQSAPRPLTAQNQQQLRLAQITDCHLFADDSLFDGINSTEYLCQTLSFLADKYLDCVMLTGDITQDHTDESFAKFAKLYRHYMPNTPLYWVAGNHDEYEQIARQLTGWPFFADKHLVFDKWQIVLIDSKGPTPSGYISESHFTQIGQRLNALADDEQVLCFCHHHPLPVYGYIDKHGLDNGQQLIDLLIKYPQIKALAYGHVHQFRYQPIHRPGQLDDLQLYATGATSIQFKVNSKVKASEDLGPACRLFCLPACFLSNGHSNNGQLSTEEILSLIHI